MNENIEHISYFETPIYSVYLPELTEGLNKASDKFINEAKKKNEDIIKKRNKNLKIKIKDFALTHHSVSLIDVPNFKILQDYVSRRSSEILEHMGYDLTGYDIFWTEFWVQEFGKDGGGHHEGHVHYDNHISGFYFLKCSDKTSFPVFHDPRIGKLVTQLPLKNESKITCGTQFINYKPKPGTLILFPSFLEHQFVVDLGIEPFRFIHFNLQAVRKIITKIK
jgi:uncharacterized protein (TIGR02466 family)